jgi:UDP-glucose 4-epimerase
MRGVTHVVHLATCKEIPETVMDVTVKGFFWLLEAFRQSTTAKQLAAMRRRLIPLTQGDL